MLRFLLKKENLEIRRQLLHLGFGLFLTFLITIDLFNIKFFSLLLAVSLIISFIAKKIKIPGLSNFLNYFDRPKDVKAFPGRGFITFLIGSLTSVLIFEYYFGLKLAAIIAVLSLTITDSFSSLYGNMFGKLANPLNKNKTVEGMIFAMAFLFIITILFLPFQLALIISVIAAMAEAVDIKIFGKTLDDNIYLPLITGTIVLIFSLI